MSEPPKGWCPECDGRSQCAPGTCCGVGAPEAARELHRHLDELQIHARRLGFCCYAAALDPNAPCPWHAPEPVASIERRAEPQEQCSFPVYDCSLSAPERCAFPAGHEGKCEA